MTRFLLVAALLATLNINGQTPQFSVEPIRLTALDKEQLFTRSIYALELTASKTDTALFIRKPKNLAIVAVDSVNRHELNITLKIDSGFVDFAAHEFALVDAAQKLKAKVSLDVRYAQIPKIDRVIVQAGGRTTGDTLQLVAGQTVATLRLRGAGLFATSVVAFDDARIRVNDTPGWRADNPPHEIQVGLQIDDPTVEPGRKTFRLKNDHAGETFGSIFLRATRPPKILSPISGFVTDGRQHEVEIQGAGFSPGIQATLLPPEGYAHATFVAPNKVTISLLLPALEQSKSFCLVLANPDGQADTSAYFSARATPLSAARALPIDHKTIFRGKKVHTLFVVETRDGWRLSRQQSYEVNIEGDVFPVVRVVNDSTCEAVIKLNEGDDLSVLNQHLFTINEVDKPARWRGMLKSRPAPKIYYVSANRFIHPTDSLAVVIKGKNLDGAAVLIDDPEVTFHTLENRGDMIRLTAIAGPHVSFGSYPLELRLDDVPFIFADYLVQVLPWQNFAEFVTFHVSSFGDLPDSTLFKGPDRPHLIQAQDAILVKIDTQKIKQEFGGQKMHISGVLTDSTNTIRAEAFDSRLVSAEHGAGTIVWRWRVREKIRSGDRIEITLKNPGGHNKITEFFQVAPHWSEAFHGSTSFILVKVPFGQTETKTGVLNSVGIGISYQPFINKRFLEFDASFLVGNSKTESIGVEVSFGLSTIFWQHLQVGVGTNLTGIAFSRQFLFLGTRFKLPFSF